MKIKFILLTFLLLFARGCDFYSTSLWYFDNPSHEANPLSSILGFGWNGLVISNLIIVGFIIYAFYFYSFKYSIHVPKTEIKNLTDFVSEYYFNEKGKFYKVFYRMPMNKEIMIGHTGYVLIRVVIIGSFLAAIHNLCQFHNIPAYNTYREIVKRPLFVIYGLIIFSFIYFICRLWKSEFDIVRQHSVGVNKNDLQ